MKTFFIFIFVLSTCTLSSGCKPKPPPVNNYDNRENDAFDVNILPDCKYNCQTGAIQVTKYKKGVKRTLEEKSGLSLNSKIDKRNLATLVDDDASDSDKVDAFEQLSFKVCEKDGNDGLTWKEIKDCKAEYCGKDKLVKSPDCPKKRNFNAFDTNKDGILEISEWKEKIEKIQQRKEKKEAKNDE